MRRPTPALLALATALGLLVLSSLAPRRAGACFAIGRAGPVPIQGEEALIVWDAARRTQHFVRRAAFRGVRSDFGFLVPTPSRPELLEVASGFFDTLFGFYGRAPDDALGAMRGGGGEGGPHGRTAGARVEVLEQRQLAGMEASVLAASDPRALTDWLRQHRYPSSPALTRWLAPYVASGWIVTAFRIDPSATPRTTRFHTSSVRMSFQTDRPFFPYSEPSAGRPRPFRVSVIAPTRVRAVLARVGETTSEPWPVAPGFADAPFGLPRLETTVPQGSIPRGSWLTTFDEPRSRRGARDLFFDPDPSTERVASTITTRIEP